MSLFQAARYGYFDEAAVAVVAVELPVAPTWPWGLQGSLSRVLRHGPSCYHCRVVLLILVDALSELSWSNWELGAQMHSGWMTVNPSLAEADSPDSVCKMITDKKHKYLNLLTELYALLCFRPYGTNYTREAIAL